MGEENTQILVVDDEKIFRNLLFRALDTQGYQVTVAKDGEEGLDLVKKQFYDIVITDVMMPKLGGIELLTKINEHSPGTIVIIITGYASLDSAMQAIKEGAYDYITKPFQIEDILHAVERAVEKIQLVRQNKKLISELEKAYLRIQGLLENKHGLSEEMALVNKELSKSQHDLLKGMFALKKYQSELAQRKYLAPELTTEKDFLLKIKDAAKMREDGKISDGEYRLIKSRLLETS